MGQGGGEVVAEALEGGDSEFGFGGARAGEEGEERSGSEQVFEAGAECTVVPVLAGGDDGDAGVVLG